MTFEVHLCLAMARRNAELTVAAEMARLRKANPKASEMFLYQLALYRFEECVVERTAEPINPRNLKVLV